MRRCAGSTDPQQTRPWELPHSKSSQSHPICHRGRPTGLSRVLSPELPPQGLGSAPPTAWNTCSPRVPPSPVVPPSRCPPSHSLTPTPTGDPDTPLNRPVPRVLTGNTGPATRIRGSREESVGTSEGSSQRQPMNCGTTALPRWRGVQGLREGHVGWRPGCNQVTRVETACRAEATASARAKRTRLRTYRLPCAMWCWLPLERLWGRVSGATSTQGQEPLQERPPAAVPGAAPPRPPGETCISPEPRALRWWTMNRTRHDGAQVPFSTHTLHDPFPRAGCREPGQDGDGGSHWPHLGPAR